MSCGPLEQGFANAIDRLQALPDDQLFDVVKVVQPALRPGIEEEPKEWVQAQEILIKMREMMHRLLSAAETSLKGSNLRQWDPAKVTSRDGDQILDLYKRVGLTEKYPAFVQTSKLAGAFAEGIGESYANRDDAEEFEGIFPQALRAMEILRNVGTSVVLDNRGAVGYLSRHVLTKILCEKLGIHEKFRDYLLPLWMHQGPLSQDEYESYSRAERRRSMNGRANETYALLTDPQGIVEFSAVAAKIQEGRILTVADILRDLHPAHSTREAVENKWGKPLWLLDDCAYERLQPDFSRVWKKVSQNLAEFFGDAPLETLRKKLQGQLSKGKL